VANGKSVLNRKVFELPLITAADLNLSMQHRVRAQPFAVRADRPPRDGRQVAQSFAAHPLAQLAAAFALGVLAEKYLVVPQAVLVSLAASATFFAAVILFKQSNARRIGGESGTTKERAAGVATVLVMVAALLLGWTLASLEKTRVPADQLRRLLNEGTPAVGEPVEVTGVLERDPETAPERLYLFLRVEKVRSREVERDVSGEVVLLAPVAAKSIEREFAELDLRYGARLRVITMLERADSFRNPGVSSFTEYLDRKGYDATGFVKSPLLVERLENARVFLPLAWLYAWRRGLQAEIDARFSGETAGVLDAAFLGNRYKLSHSTSERFRDGGTFHVLVISGLHITFLGGLVFLIARRFTKNRGLQFLLSATVLWAYSLAVGAESSVVRAALMFTFVIFAPIVSRRASSLNVLGGAALVLLAWRPADLFDPSFQLTFVSVLAMVVLAWPLLEKMAEIGSWRPTRATPYPPACAPWLRTFCEILFWSERESQRELEHLSYSYRLFKSPLAATLERLHLQHLLRYAFAAIAVSGCVQLALLPFLVVYFHRLSLASLVLNIGVSLMMAGVALVAAAGLVVAQVSAAAAAPLISAANALNWLMVHSVDPFASVGMSSLRLPEYAGWARGVYVLYFLPLVLLAVSLSRWQPLQLPGAWRSNRRRRRLARAGLWAQAIAIAAIVVHPFSAGSAPGELRVDFLDVGQGDCALVTFPDNTTLLIDGGGRPGPFKRNVTTTFDDGSEETFERETRSIGEAVVSEYLWSRGLDHVDYILATHADADHMDGLNDVARNFSVRAALVARTPDRDDEYATFAKTLSAKNVPVRLIGAGDVLHFGAVTASVLWPTPSTNAQASSSNNDSVVLRLRLGERTLLLTGDIEKGGENGILQAQNLRADVVKVAHHGSKTSSTPSFVAAVQPRFAVISVGQASVFGHPNKEVVERWKAGRAQVLTTGASGTITVTTDGRDLTVEIFVKRE
jgi:competence protein ComEC